jgi:hypothetical protein
MKRYWSEVWRGQCRLHRICRLKLTNLKQSRNGRQRTWSRLPSTSDKQSAAIWSSNNHSSQKSEARKVSYLAASSSLADSLQLLVRQSSVTNVHADRAVTAMGGYPSNVQFAQAIGLMSALVRARSLSRFPSCRAYIHPYSNASFPPAVPHTLVLCALVLL